jgi:hypothetical protein
MAYNIINLEFAKQYKGRNRKIVVTAFSRETIRKNINWMPLCTRE